jgi:hypothetical protein
MFCICWISWLSDLEKFLTQLHALVAKHGVEHFLYGIYSPYKRYLLNQYNRYSGKARGNGALIVMAHDAETLKH